MEPGIYFSLPEADYHADEALGSTDIKKLCVDPIDWQFARLHVEDKETDALIYGRALHCRVLEGAEAFDKRYCRAFNKQDVPADTMRTVDDLKRFLRENGSMLSGKKEDLITRAKMIPGCPPIYDLLEADYMALNDGKEPLSVAHWDSLETAINWMQADELLSPIMDAGTFQLGAPEVSIFYEDAGVKLKLRLDYLLGHAIVDLKSFAPMFAEKPAYAIPKAIIRYRYDLQAAAYIRGFQRARNFWEEGRIFGEEPFPGFLEKCYSRRDPDWIWVFLKSTGAPQPFVRQLALQSDVFKVAQWQVETAIKRYRELVERYGRDNDWPPQNAPETLASDDFPSWFQDR
jgi:hypothetical protein